MIEAQLREHFGEVAATCQPPAAISTDAAKLRARRSLRLRRAGAATLSAGMVVAVVVAATLAGESSGPSSRQGSGQSSVRPRGPASFQVATSRLSFAWLPSGIRVAAQTASATRLSARLSGPGNMTAGAEGWDVSVLAAGQCRLSAGTLRCGGQVVAYPTLRAPEVDGGIAYWGSDTSNSFASLSFEYAARSWASIVYWSGRTSRWFTHASQGEILRIARGLTPARGSPVRLPVRLAGLPGWKLTYTERMWYALTDGSVSARLSPAPGAVRPRSGRGAVTGSLSLLITPASAHQTCAVYPPARHLTINGDAVVIESQTVYPPGGPQNGQLPVLESQTLCAANAGGLMITLTVTGTAPVSLTSLFSHLRPGPEASRWTGEPVQSLSFPTEGG
jgi:hypothetical protein